MQRNLRAIRRAISAVGLALFLMPLVVLQGVIVGPLFKNYKTIPQLVYGSGRRLFGIKIEFNKASVPLEEKRPTWFVANHMSDTDIIVLGSALKGIFIGKGEINQWPVISQMGKAVKYIGVERVRKEHPDFKKYHKQAIGKITKNFNEGHSAIMFPEGTTTDGNEVALFRAGLISALFNQKGTDEQGNEIALEKEVLLQPIALRIKDVEGKSVESREDLRHFYTHYYTESALKRIWMQLSTKSITIELTVFPTMNPKEYKDQFEMINKAGDLVRSIVAPNQKTVAPVDIPGVDDKKFAR